jgi:hypothetical protein
MKYLVFLITLASIGAIIYGFNLPEDQLKLAHKYIGFGTVGAILF